MIKKKKRKSLYIPGRVKIERPRRVGSYNPPSPRLPHSLACLRAPLRRSPTTSVQATPCLSAAPTLRGARRDVVGEKEKRGGLETPVQKVFGF